MNNYFKLPKKGSASRFPTPLYDYPLSHYAAFGSYHSLLPFEAQDILKVAVYSIRTNRLNDEDAEAMMDEAISACRKLYPEHFLPELSLEQLKQLRAQQSEPTRIIPLDR